LLSDIRKSLLKQIGGRAQANVAWASMEGAS
jgi:hypothetical protein